MEKAVSFAKSERLLGIVAEATPIIKQPTLIKMVKEQGMVFDVVVLQCVLQGLASSCTACSACCLLLRFPLNVTDHRSDSLHLW